MSSSNANTVYTWLLSVIESVNDRSQLPSCESLIEGFINSFPHEKDMASLLLKSKTEKERSLMAYQFTDNVLAEGFDILFGADWKKHYTITDKAREMRSIISGGTQPCCAFQNWVNLIEFLNDTFLEEKRKAY